MTGTPGVIITGLAGLVLAGGAVAYALLADRDGSPLDPGDPDKVAVGARLYAEHCAACHGAALEGQPDWRRRLPNNRLPAPPHDETGHTWHHPAEQLFAFTKHGPAVIVGGGYQGDMPAYAGTLSDAEIWAVLSYIKSRWPAEIQARHATISER